MGKRFKVSGYNDLRCNGVKWNDVIQGWSLVFNPKKKVELFLPFDGIEEYHSVNQQPSVTQLSNWAAEFPWFK